MPSILRANSKKQARRKSQCPSPRKCPTPAAIVELHDFLNTLSFPMSSSILLESVAEVLRRMELVHTLDPEHDIVNASIDLDHGRVEFLAHFDPECRVHELFVRFPIYSREEQNARSADFTCRHNVSVRKFTLCFNPDGGYWSFRLTFNRDADGSINGELLEEAIRCLLRYSDNLFPYLLRLLAGNEKPATLIEQFEAKLAAFLKPEDDAIPPDQA